jgi:hypothetical protein
VSPDSLDPSDEGGGIGLTIKNPRIMGRVVPKPRRSRRDEGSPWKKSVAIVEKKNAERPKPEITMPLTVARWGLL